MVEGITVAAETQTLAIVRAEPTAVTRTPLLEPGNLAELQQLGTLMAQSGFFQDARQAAQACVKIMAGREMGFPPIASMCGISIIEGKPATGANLLAAAMKRAGYSWRVVQRDAKGCKLIMSFRGEEIGPTEFLEDDAKRAELLNKKNWQRYPRSMYFARCISDAARTYAPEVLAGLPAYTAEELGAENTDEDGNVIITKKEAAEQQLAVAQQRIAEEKAKLEAEEKKQDHTRPVHAASAPPVAPPAAAAETAGGGGNRTAPASEVEPDVQELWKRMGTSRSGIKMAFEALKVQLTAACSGNERVAMEHYKRILGHHGVEHYESFKNIRDVRQCAREIFLFAKELNPPQEEFTATDDDLPADLFGNRAEGDKYGVD